MNSRGEPARLCLRLPARVAQTALLRAELRLWLMANHDADEDDVLGFLAAATQAFSDALSHPEQPRTIAVEVEATYAAGVVAISLHDYAGPHGNTVELQRPLKPARHPVIAAQSMAAEARAVRPLGR